MSRPLFILLLLFMTGNSFAFQLNNGIVQGNDLVFTEEMRDVLPKISLQVNKVATVDELQYSIAFIKLGETSQWYRLYASLDLFGVDVASESLLGHWTLARWTHHLDYIERTSRLNDLSIKNGDYNIDIRSPLGCLNATPLRYGDVDGDGTNEIVLVLGNDLVVFSAEQRRIVFSVSFNLFDWMPSEETHYLYEDEGGEYLKPDSEPQYASALFNTYRLQRENIKGYRGYSKLFESDFDEDGFADFLIWQKVYESKLERDSVRGFDQVRNEFMHYERDLTAQAESEAGVTGEYLPQDTPEADIQKWLAENSLTWSKGYPSKSECAGEEGQSIPEMHDPLLNDPEVLQ
jgi:hypothetical protein